MNQSSPREPDRMDELLAARALQSLDSEEVVELRRLQQSSPERDDESLERTAAVLELAVGFPETDPLPEHLSRLITAGGVGYLEGRNEQARIPLWTEDPGNPEASTPTPSQEPRLIPREPQLESRLQDAGRAQTSDPASPRTLPQRNRGLVVVPWLVTAATILVSISLFFEGREPDPIQARTQFIEKIDDVVRSPWKGQSDLVAAVTGDAVWSDREQHGYLHFHGMRVNDPTIEQYQLWIIDDRQAHPVDGGVFDIDSEGDIVIPIDAKIKVGQPKVFAVTIEKPGGVVISDKKRLILLAEVT